MENYLELYKQIEARRIECGGHFAQDFEGEPASLALFVPLSAFANFFFSKCEDFAQDFEGEPKANRAISRVTAAGDFVQLPPLCRVPSDGFPCFEIEIFEERRRLPLSYFVRLGGLGRDLRAFDDWRELLAGFLSLILTEQPDAIAKRINEGNFNAFAFLEAVLEIAGKPKEGERAREFLTRITAALSEAIKTIEEEKAPEALNMALPETMTEAAASFAEQLEEIKEELEKKAPEALEVESAFNFLFSIAEEDNGEEIDKAKAAASIPSLFVANNIAVALDRLHFNFTEATRREDIERGLEWARLFETSKTGLNKIKGRLRRIEKRLEEIGGFYLTEEEREEAEELKRQEQELRAQLEALTPESLKEKSKNIFVFGGTVYKNVGSIETYINEVGEIETERGEGEYITRISIPPLYALRESEGFINGTRGIVRTIELLGLAKARKTGSATVYFTNAEIAEIVLGKATAATASEAVIKNAKQAFKNYADVLRKRDIKAARLAGGKGKIKRVSADIYGAEVFEMGSDYKGVWLKFNLDLIQVAVLASSYFPAELEGEAINSPMARNAFIGLRMQENNPSNLLTGAYSLDALGEMLPELPAPAKYEGHNYGRDILEPYRKVFEAIPAALMDTCELPKGKAGQAVLLTAEGARKRKAREEARARRENKKKKKAG